MESSDVKTFAAMQEGKPYRTYKKTILGKVYLSLLDPFSGNPTGLLLSGDPRKNEESSIVDVWSEREDLFLKRQNKLHFERGIIVSFTRPETEERVRVIEEYSDEELKELINSQFMKLQHAINKTESEIVLTRMIDLAKELDKSDKIVSAIEKRLSEIQSI